MEDTLRVPEALSDFNESNSLNPCFNGRYSQRLNGIMNIKSFLGLNPCFNGRYSQRVRRDK